MYNEELRGNPNFDGGGFGVVFVLIILGCVLLLDTLIK